MGLLASTGHLCRVQLLGCDGVHGSSRVPGPGQSPASSHEAKLATIRPRGLLLLTPENGAPAGTEEAARGDLVDNGHQQRAGEQRVLEVMWKGACSGGGWTPVETPDPWAASSALARAEANAQPERGGLLRRFPKRTLAGDGTPPLPLRLLQPLTAGKWGFSISSGSC